MYIDYVDMAGRS